MENTERAERAESSATRDQRTQTPAIELMTPRGPQR